MESKDNLITLPDDISLYPYQIDSLNRQIKDFIALNKESDSYEIKRCPKCGSTTARFVKAGFSNFGNSGKFQQLYKCSECHKRFTKNNGQLTWYSQQDSSKWNALIKATNAGASLKETAAELDVSEYTAFRMRHKYLHFLESFTDEIILSDEIELDEKYVSESHKGKKIEGIKGKKRGIPSTKRGLSDEKVCIASGVKRQSGCFLKSFNKGNPSSEDLKNLENNIKEGSFVWTDGKTSYNRLLEDKHCPSRKLKDHTTYNCVDHLNNVNCLHSLIEQWYAKARGVATKYINRYCALWSIRYIFRDCDSQETLLKLIAMFRNKNQYFLVRQVTTEDLCLI